ncbi:MAG: O-antigen ligase family protein [Candidatus Omnitrophica bacterium]|nr:O-antigen ligase family protein [Candidatus Omnitrophota bacterium]
MRNFITHLYEFPLGKDYINILLIFLLIGWVVSSMGQGRKFADRSALNWILVVLVVYTFFSFIQGYLYLHESVQFSFSDTRLQMWKNYCMLPLLFFIAFNTVRDEKTVWQLLMVICFSLLIVEYYTVTQVTWFHGILSRTKIHGTFEYLGPNEVAAFLNQYTVILIAMLIGARKMLYKLILFLMISGNIYAILFLYSRGAYIGLLVGMGFLFLFKKQWMLIPLIAVCIFWNTFLPSEIQDRITSTTNQYGELDESNMGRIHIWQESMEIFKQNPITGAGFGVFGKLGLELGDTHNIYLKVLAEQGVIGMIIFLILLGIMWGQGIFLFRYGNDDFVKLLGIGFSACMVTMFINNLFGDRWTYVEVSSHLWVFLALVCRLNFLAKDKKI